MKSTKLILVGGFLGAGKTTLLLNTATKLTEQGLRVGIITNDQASELVDSGLMRLNNVRVEEVTGGCFSCNFDALQEAIQRLQSEVMPDIILAEPIGSSTDLTATVIRPLKKYMEQEVTVAPLTVLADPSRLSSILDGGYGGLHPDVAYVYHTQLEESDMILINKSDLFPDERMEALKQRTAKAYPQAKVSIVSGLCDEGIDEWLEVATAGIAADEHPVDVDYAIYANAETALGWLNGTVFLQGVKTNWEVFTRKFLTDLSHKFDEDDYAVGHVKVLTENEDQFVVGNITGTKETLSFRGNITDSYSARIIVNARVETTPRRLSAMVRETLNSLMHADYRAEIQTWRYLQSGIPTPTYRFSETI
ncbi:cobalamin synthesis protein P47K [Parabacteroides sp. OttesenSCG-928-G07]|nr:cobalamin synthesis protein P47K [Parabacteroides sp. OttesenSCG-928-G21]MDL2278179.1 cobalamin synthesis protein P47K [Parabacteroides sp. OttesenSCG-928-G07]